MLVYICYVSYLKMHLAVQDARYVLDQFIVQTHTHTDIIHVLIVIAYYNGFMVDTIVFLLSYIYCKL